MTALDLAEAHIRSAREFWIASEDLDAALDFIAQAKAEAPVRESARSPEADAEQIMHLQGELSEACAEIRALRRVVEASRAFAAEYTSERLEQLRRAFSALDASPDPRQEQAMTCVHEMAFGIHRAYVNPDGTPGPCILCENDRLRAALERAATALDEVGWKWKGDAEAARAALRTAQEEVRKR
jgi:hypothetical protein